MYFTIRSRSTVLGILFFLVLTSNMAWAGFAFVPTTPRWATFYALSNLNSGNNNRQNAANKSADASQKYAQDTMKWIQKLQERLNVWNQEKNGATQSKSSVDSGGVDYINGGGRATLQSTFNSNKTNATNMMNAINAEKNLPGNQLDPTLGNWQNHFNGAQAGLNALNGIAPSLTTATAPPGTLTPLQTALTNQIDNASQAIQTLQGKISELQGNVVGNLQAAQANTAAGKAATSGGTLGKMLPLLAAGAIGAGIATAAMANRPSGGAATALPSTGISSGISSVRGALPTRPMAFSAPSVAPTTAPTGLSALPPSLRREVIDLSNYH